MADKETSPKTEAERRMYERLNAQHRRFMESVGQGYMDGDVVHPDSPRRDRRTDQEIADGVEPYFE